MRSTTFTSTGAATGASLAAGPPVTREGFQRLCTPEHLAAHHDQAISGTTGPIDCAAQIDLTDLDIRARIADRGHARGASRAGGLLPELTICRRHGDGAAQEITTVAVWVAGSEGCGGTLSLAERPGVPTTPPEFRDVRRDVRKPPAMTHALHERPQRCA